MNDSIWQNLVVFREHHALEGERKTDVLIIGGGLAGLLCAHALMEAGVSCILIEGDRICGGITQNTTAKITSQHGLIYHRLFSKFGAERTLQYYQAHESAVNAYRELAAQIPCDFEMKSNYIFSTTDRAKMDKELETLSRLGIPSRYRTDLPLPFPTCGAVAFADQAQFHPIKFAAQLSDGLDIFEHTPVREFLGNSVRTDLGSITASKIIIATHFPIINKHGSFFLKMYQNRSYVIGLERQQPLDGMYLDEAENGFSFRSYGNHLLIGGGGHRTGKQGEGWRGLEHMAEQYYHNHPITYRWAAQDCMTLDGIPYIGQYSKNTPDLYVATGFNKWGMTSSMVASMILRDLVQGRENAYAELFSPSRSILHPQLLINGAEAISNILRLKRPRCPHLGCALQWNSHEHSWDCPCHGSRFSEDGMLLDNPATAGLKKRKKDENIEIST